jgi:hypothetical protein
VTIIPLALSSLTGSSDRPGGLRRAACGTPPYLVLLRAGFCLPPVLPQARCALTAPFHHCLCVARACASTARSAVYFLCHYPSSCPDRALPGALPCGVRTFLLRLRGGDDRLAHCDIPIVARGSDPRVTRRLSPLHAPTNEERHMDYLARNHGRRLPRSQRSVAPAARLLPVEVQQDRLIGIESRTT